jgi:putative serine protease PepD
MLAVCLAPEAAPAQRSDIYRRMLQSTGWVYAKDEGNVTRNGTCWVVDRERRLALTCNHVVGGARTVMVYFPRYRGNGSLVQDPENYRATGEPIAGRVLLKDRKCDLALVRLEMLPSAVRALPLASASPRTGTRVHLVGTSGRKEGRLWTHKTGITRSAKFTVANLKGTGVRLEARVLTIRMAVAHGDSGGPIVDDHGKLVAVNSSNVVDGKGIRANGIDVSEVRKLLREAYREWRGPGFSAD